MDARDGVFPRDYYLPRRESAQLLTTAEHETKATEWNRRYPQNSEIDPSLSISELWPKLRALPDKFAPYYQIHGTQIKLQVSVSRPYAFDADMVEVIDCCSPSISTT